MPTDKFGAVWSLPTGELCPECGQPDNCGDCRHLPLDRNDVIRLGGVPVFGLTVEEACKRAGISYPNPFVNVKGGAANGM